MPEKLLMPPAFVNEVAGAAEFYRDTCINPLLAHLTAFTPSEGPESARKMSSYLRLAMQDCGISLDILCQKLPHTPMEEFALISLGQTMPTLEITIKLRRVLIELLQGHLTPSLTNHLN